MSYSWPPVSRPDTTQVLWAFIDRRVRTQEILLIPHKTMPLSSLLEYMAQLSWERKHILAAQASTLLSYAECYSPDESGLVVPWDVWGPVSSRYFHGPSCKLMASVAGQSWIVGGAIRDFCRAVSALQAQHTTGGPRVHARHRERIALS